MFVCGSLCVRFVYVCVSEFDDDIMRHFCIIEHSIWTSNFAVDRVPITLCFHAVISPEPTRCITVWYQSDAGFMSDRYFANNWPSGGGGGVTRVHHGRVGSAGLCDLKILHPWRRMKKGVKILQWTPPTPPPPPPPPPYRICGELENWCFKLHEMMLK